MERHLGRSLHEDETVHHVNGNKTDNRLENLELWSTSHPSGQRVSDKIAWARGFLERYASNPNAPEILEALKDCAELLDDLGQHNQVLQRALDAISNVDEEPSGNSVT